MRTFLAIELSQAARDRLAQLQAELQQRLAGAPLRWADADQAHLTLRFLGETSREQARQIAAATASLAAATPSLGLAFAGLGCFPTCSHPRVIWVGVTGELDRLQRLQQQLETLAQQAGFAPEPKPFSPHITLARAPRRLTPVQQRQLGAELQAYLPRIQGPEQEWGAMVVRELVHLQSDLRPEGALYMPLGHYALL